MKRTRRQRRSSRKSKRGGGDTINCEAEGFSYDMRVASLGREYKNPVGHIHSDGERWTFEDLVFFTMNGRIIDWYIQQLKYQGIIFTAEDIQRIKTNPDLQVLGAFFHRYKIVAEKIAVLRRNVAKGISAFFTRYSAYTGKNSYGKLLADKNTFARPLPTAVLESLPIFVRHVSVNTTISDLPIEMAIDRAQCLMFYIVKQKGMSPPGFQMDPRIERRAKAPILIDGDLDAFAALKLDPTLKWLEFLEEASNDLRDPPVTFGLFA